MLVAAVVLVAFVSLVLAMIYLYAPGFPSGVLSVLGKFFLLVSSIETLFIVWILVFVFQSEWSLWGLSFNEFWKEQLAFIYFIKEWLYSWFWNDLLNLVLEFLPAVVFLSMRTIVTTVLGIWFLKLSRLREAN